MALNWKDNEDKTRSTALASRVVGGKYFIKWIEHYYSEQTCELLKVRRYSVDYQTKGGGGIGNVDQTHAEESKRTRRSASRADERVDRKVRR
jgi:hypothetical protein